MRITKPLQFLDGEKVRDFGELKKAFEDKNKHSDIIGFIVSNDLENFFRGMGKDDISNTISELKAVGMPHKEIASKIAEIIKVKADFTDIDFSIDPELLKKNARELLENEDAEVSFPSGSYPCGDCSITKSKKIKGLDRERVRLEITELVIDTPDKVSFDGISISSIDSTGRVVLKNGSVVMRNVALSGIELVVLGGSIDFQEGVIISECNTGITYEGGKVTGLKDEMFESIKNKLSIGSCAILTDNFKNIYIEDGKIIIKEDINLLGPVVVDGFTLNIGSSNEENVSVYADNEAFIVKNNGILSVTKINVKAKSNIKEGNNNCVLIKSENSRLNIESCTVTGSYSDGVAVSKSELNLLKTEISGNKRYGIKIEDGSEVTVKKSTIKSNGTSGEDEQIDIDSSRLSMEGSKVLDGWLGIFSDKSTMYLLDVEISGNKLSGIYIGDDSDATIKKSMVKSNGTSGKTQIITNNNSRLSMEESKVIDSLGDAAGIVSVKSKIDLHDVEISGNKYNGIVIKDGSEVTVKKSTIKSNGTIKPSETSRETYFYNQIFTENSKLSMEESKVIDSGGDGIVSLKSTMDIIGGDISGNKGLGIYIEDGYETTISKSTIKSNGTSGAAYVQVYTKKSELFIKESKVIDSLGGKGIESDKSTMYLLDVEISGNKGHGIFIKDDSSVTIKKSTIKSNGTSGEAHAQIYTANSKLSMMEESKVLDSLNGSGINSLKSKIDLLDVEISGNKLFGIVIKDDSSVTIKKSTIKSNGTSGKEYDQISTNNSKLFMEESKVLDSLGGNGIYIDQGSVYLEGCEISRNQYGIFNMLHLFKVMGTVMYTDVIFNDNRKAPKYP